MYLSYDIRKKNEYKCHLPFEKIPVMLLAKNMMTTMAMYVLVILRASSSCNRWMVD